MTEYDRALSLQATDEDGAFVVDLSRDWSIGAAVNGGFLMSVVGEAARRVTVERGHPDPLTFTAHFLSAAQEGPADVRVDLVRSGRTQSTLSASLAQGGTDRVRVLAAYGDLAGLPDERLVTIDPPAMPPPEQCVRNDQMPAGNKPGPFLDRLDLRLDPDTAGWAVGEPTHRGRIQGWVRTPDDRAPDPVFLLMILDCLPPVTFDFGRYGWAPTVELTAHLAALPEPGWLQVRLMTDHYAGGLVSEDAEVWDSTGRLVARARQLAREPRQR